MLDSAMMNGCRAVREGEFCIGHLMLPWHRT
jgi:hypothetical protein